MTSPTSFKPISSPVKAKSPVNEPATETTAANSELKEADTETSKETSASTIKMDSVSASNKDNGDEKHACHGSNRAMVECEQCGCFSHAECAFTLKKSGDLVMRVCSNCFKAGENSAISTPNTVSSTTTSTTNSNNNPVSSANENEENENETNATNEKSATGNHGLVDTTANATLTQNENN